jgi:hypothetical protein
VRTGLSLLLALPLASCGSSIVPTPGMPPPAAGYTPASRPEPTGVIGADARGLVRLFGEPRLDIRDPTARKLQFANPQCVLDAYLYPPALNREPVVTHVDARSGTGNDMDWNACVKLLRGR